MADRYGSRSSSKHLFGEDVSEADVLRLGLDGHLKLSVNFVNGARGRCGPAVPIDDEKWTIRQENPDDWSHLTGGPPTDEDTDEHQVFWCSLNGLPLGDGRVLEYVRETALLDGVWDLTMLGHERLEIEQRYQFLTEGPEVDMYFRDGPLVFRPGNSLTKSREFLENGVSSSGPDEGL